MIHMAYLQLFQVIQTMLARVVPQEIMIPSMISLLNGFLNFKKLENTNTTVSNPKFL